MTAASPRPSVSCRVPACFSKRKKLSFLQTSSLFAISEVGLGSGSCCCSQVPACHLGVASFLPPSTQQPRLPSGSGWSVPPLPAVTPHTLLCRSRGSPSWACLPPLIQKSRSASKLALQLAQRGPRCGPPPSRRKHPATHPAGPGLPRARRQTGKWMRAGQGSPAAALPSLESSSQRGHPSGTRTGPWGCARCPPQPPAAESVKCP